MIHVILHEQIIQKTKYHSKHQVVTTSSNNGLMHACSYQTVSFGSQILRILVTVHVSNHFRDFI